MDQQFEIHPSRLQLAITLLGLALAAITALVYLDSKLLLAIYLSAILLLTLAELDHARQADSLRLILYPQRQSVALEEGGQPYFYIKYKVHPTRWFAILKLIDQRKTRTLILNSDRFNSVQAYQSCRYLLTQLERPSHAA